MEILPQKARQAQESPQFKGRNTRLLWNSWRMKRGLVPGVKAPVESSLVRTVRRQVRPFDSKWVKTPSSG